MGYTGAAVRGRKSKGTAATKPMGAGRSRHRSKDRGTGTPLGATRRKRAGSLESEPAYQHDPALRHR